MSELGSTTIIAVDFDGTLTKGLWPDIAEPNTVLINELIHEREHGSKVILWTCRTGKYLQEAIDWCKEQGLIFDAVNQNIPELIERYGEDSRKVIADIYIDDKSMWPYWEKES